MRPRQEGGRESKPQMQRWDHPPLQGKPPWWRGSPPADPRASCALPPTAEHSLLSQVLFTLNAEPSIPMSSVAPSKNLNMFCLIKKMSNIPYRSNREEKKRRRMPLEIQTHCRKAELSTAPYRAHVSRVLLLIKCRNTSTIQMQWIKLEQACKSQIPLAKKLPLCMWTSHEVFPF